jgi:hypothetical protein
MKDVTLVWGSPGDIEQTSDGGGEFASTFTLTLRGVAKLAVAFGCDYFRSADFCGCPDPSEGDGLHIAGEPSDLICLASPLPKPQASHPVTPETEQGDKR